MIRYMIVEDEYVLGYRLERMITELRPSWKMVCRTAGVEESIEALNEHDVDLIFMDIELSDGNCFEIFDTMEIRNPVIFITAYDEYALQAFKADCVEYLLKPVTKISLQAALDKLDRLTGFPGHAAAPDYRSLREHIRPSSPESGAGIKDRLLIPEGDGYAFINIKDVAWFIKSGRYTDIRTFSGRHHLIDRSLDHLEGEVDRKMFFRTSRNCMVNINSIRSIQRHGAGRLRLITVPPPEPDDIIVSQARREEFLLWIEGGSTTGKEEF